MEILCDRAGRRDYGITEDNTIRIFTVSLAPIVRDATDEGLGR